MQRDRALRLAVAAATVASAIIFLSTGTNPPGSLAFNVLYGLPFGWLLREPGRFLIVVSLMYAVLIAVVIEASVRHRSIVHSWVVKGRRWAGAFRVSTALVTLAATVSVSIGDFQILRARRFAGPFRSSMAIAALGVAVSLGFPMYTGAVVSDSKPNLPPSHVRMPAYWNEMARYTDELPTRGALLVLPPDDFYAMRYKWGYYGSDSFINELFHRHVVVPNGQGYTRESSQVLNAVTLTGQSILDHDWTQTEALVRTLDTPLILVRRDIESTYPGRVVLHPDDLALALSVAPNFELLHSAGSLDLFGIRANLADIEYVSTPVTIDSQVPDLRLLALLPPDTAMVSSPVRADIPNVSRAPSSPDMWQMSGNSLVWTPAMSSGWKYLVADPDTKIVKALDNAGSYAVGSPNTRVDYTPTNSVRAVTVSVSGRPAMSNGDFAQGKWPSVIGCNGMPPAMAGPESGGSLISGGAPGGYSALRLAASAGRACEGQALSWHGGSLVVSIMLHRVSGHPLRVCLLEEVEILSRAEQAPRRCAALPDLPNRTDWFEYRASVTPDPGTKTVRLYLYADGDTVTPTVSEFANVRVLEIAGLPSIALLPNPEGSRASSMQLVVLHNSFSTLWTSNAGQHAVVNGMLNGWLLPSAAQPFSALYKPTTLLQASQGLSLSAALLIVILILAPLLMRRAATGRLDKTLAKLRIRVGTTKEPADLPRQSD
jgi:hypothetical protein